MNYNSAELNRIWQEAKKIADKSNMVFIGLENNGFKVHINDKFSVTFDPQDLNRIGYEEEDIEGIGAMALNRLTDSIIIVPNTPREY